MKNLNICTIQMDILWENSEGNRKKIEKLITDINDQSVDLIVLPEMFTTGFSMDAQKIAEKHEDAMISLNWMRKIAKKYQAVITGSIAVEDRGRYYNRLYWVKPSGDYSYYDKNHLFAYAGEDRSYSCGKTKLIEEINGWKILPLICFDLRFPVWSSNQLIDGKPQYDVLIYVANWPERRKSHWNKLLLARAIENQSYLVGVNRVGKDANGIAYSGNSVVIDFLGEYMTSHNEFEESIAFVSLKKSSLDAYRKSFPVLK